MIIKKYKNRKYYCPERKKFVDQNFIIRSIMIEEEFIIVNNWNDDITLKVYRAVADFILFNSGSKNRWS
ncbi:hypothetical protein ES705_41672 [subsurface metagenome]